MLGRDALLPDWLERFADRDLRAAHRSALERLSLARRERRVTLDRHSRISAEQRLVDDALAAEVAAERRAVDAEVRAAMLAMADLIDRVTDLADEQSAPRGRVQSARRDSAWLRREAEPLSG